METEIESLEKPDAQDVIDAFEDGRLYLHRSEFRCGTYGHCEKVHVMSNPAGGEIRGYQRPVGSDRPWQICTPNYMGVWHDLDREVERRAGIAIERSMRHDERT